METLSLYLTKVFIIASFLTHFGTGSSGLVRYQRGDQGPDDDLSSSEIHINSNTVITDLVIPPIGGPNVCR